MKTQEFKDQILQGYWAMVEPKGHIDYTSISHMRKICIARFLYDTNMDWKMTLKVGWRCVKVDITFKPARTSTLTR